MTEARAVGGVRTLVGVVALVLLVCGSVLAAAGAVGVWVDGTRRDADGFLTTGARSFHSNGYALSFGAVDMRWTEVAVPVGQDWLGVVELRGDQDVFVGIGAADDVAEYLAEVEYDEVRVREAAIGYRHHPGGPAPSVPAARPIWVAYGTGSLAWQAEEGEWAAVLLNPDGSRVVDSKVSARATVPALGPVSATALLGGVVVLAVGGVVLLSAGVRGRKRPNGQ
ncbi:hypothetical protein [Umezawaea sp. NPDC059074]|uniref:hypothetical protein n=1 Tax=Umezawaea sp. NPDC059074 TaxID=3346716 RepID=UPI00368CDAA2